MNDDQEDILNAIGEFNQWYLEKEKGFFWWILSLFGIF